MNQRQRERVLLGLDEAFGVRVDRSTEGGATTHVSSLDADAIYRKLDEDILTSLRPQQIYERSIDEAIGSLFTKSSGPGVQERLKKKTVMLANTRSQVQQQSQEARLKRQALRQQRPSSGRCQSREVGKQFWKDDKGCYADYVPLSEAWEVCMRDLLGITDGSEMQGQRQAWQCKILTADMHGARLSVCDSKNIADIDLAGIVIRESKTAFHIMTTKNQVKLVPKGGRQFTLNLSPHFFILYGKSLVDRQQFVTSPLLKKGKEIREGIGRHPVFRSTQL